MTGAAGADVRCEWGQAGLAAALPLCDVVVIVDVLSFATCVEVAVARAASALGRRVLVLAAGEQWPDGSLRPCLEDWLGAGTIVDALPGAVSGDAEAARAAFRAAGPALSRMLHECRSGQELIDRGWAADVAMAAERDVSAAVPALRDGAYHRLDSA